MDSINILAYYFNLVKTYVLTYVLYLYQEFSEFAWVVKIAAISITITAILIIVTLIRIFMTRWKDYRKNKVEKKIDERYGEGIRYIMSEEAGPKLSRDEVMKAFGIDRENYDRRALLKDSKERMAFARLLYRTRIDDNSVLDRRRNLQIAISLFGIQEYLEEIINKGKNHRKVEALLMLRAFKVPTNQWVANQLINSKRKRVQRLAMYASIMSSSNMDLEYFESEFFDKNCCLYDEIQLGFVLQRRLSVKRKIPNLAHWAHMQKNSSTQCVFIRLMRQFNQVEYCSELEELFTHNSDSELIQEIARTWGYLHYIEGEELMREMLMTQADDTKVAIMHALTRLDTGQSLNALLDGYTNSGSPHVKFEALRCMYFYGDAGRAKFNELKEKASVVDKPLFAFFDDEIMRDKLPLSDDDLYRSEYGDNLFAVY